MTRRGIALALLIISLPALFAAAGCWNRHEPESHAIVLAIGLDYDEAGKMYEAIVEIAVPGAMGGGGGGGGDGGGGGGGLGRRPSQVLSARGRTVFEALTRIKTSLPRTLFWTHAEVVIFSEALARKGLLPVLDFFAREQQSRLFIIPLVTDSDLKALMDTTLPLEQLTGLGLLAQFESIGRTDAVVPPTDLRIMLMSLSQPGIDPFIPRVFLAQQGQQQGGGQGQEQGGAVRQPGDGAQPVDTIAMSGGAAFRGDRMTGWLNSKATRGWYWITGQARRGTVVFRCPDGGESHAGVEIFQSSSKIRPSVKGGRPAVTVEITVEGSIQDVTGASFLLARQDAAAVLNRLLAEVVRDEAYASLGRARELGSDIFGFGRAFYRAMPQKWVKFEAAWEDHFRTLQVDIQVKARIRRTGLKIEPLKQKR